MPQPTTSPRRAHAGAGFFLVIFVLFLVLGRTRLLQDPDIFWHIAVGRGILETGQLPETDQLTCTFAGEDWIANQWLAELLLCVVEKTAGWDGVLIAAAVVLAAVYAWVAGRLVSCGLHPLAAGLVLALGVAASTYNLHARPHLSTLILLGVVFGMLSDVEHGRRPRAALWILVPIFVVWTNLHGGVLGGLGTLALYTAGGSVMQFCSQPSPIQESRRDFWTFAGLLACSTLTILVNPYGLQLLTAWSRILAMNLPDLVIEHAPLDPSQPEGATVLVLAAFYCVALVSARRRPRITWLVPLAWFYLACMRIRHAPLFAMVTLLALADVLPESRLSDWLHRRGLFERTANGITAPSGGNSWLAAALLPALIFVSAAAINHSGASFASRGVWAAPDRSIWPAKLLPAIKVFESRLSGPVAVFNEQRFGGFLIYNAPGLRVFIDGRCELFGESFLRAYMQARRDPAAVTEWVRQYDLRAALTKSGSAFDHYFADSDRWVMIQRSASASFYIRRNALGR